MAVCLQLEAGTFGLKTLVLRAARSPVSSDGISVVMGRRYRLDSDGRLVQEDSRHDPVAEIQYAFALFSEWLYRMAWAPNYEGPGWKAVGTTFRVRDRIAHPGSLSDIEIGSLELEQAKKAFRWFIRNVNLGLLQCIKKMHEDIGAPLDPAWPEWHRTLLAEMEAEGI
jgi:hypothetical protein